MVNNNEESCAEIAHGYDVEDDKMAIMSAILSVNIEGMLASLDIFMTTSKLERISNLIVKCIKAEPGNDGFAQSLFEGKTDDEIHMIASTD